MLYNYGVKAVYVRYSSIWRGIIEAVRVAQPVSLLAHSPSRPLSSTRYK